MGLQDLQLRHVVSRSYKPELVDVEQCSKIFLLDVVGSFGRVSFVSFWVKRSFIVASSANATMF